MNKKDLEFHKRKARESEKLSEKFANDLGLTVEDLRTLANKPNQKH